MSSKIVFRKRKSNVYISFVHIMLHGQSVNKLCSPAKNLSGDTFPEQSRL